LLIERIVRIGMLATVPNPRPAVFVAPEGIEVINA